MRRGRLSRTRLKVTEVDLQPWTERDMSLLRGLNAPAMTEHLGGPETEEQLDVRLRRYARAQSDSVSMFKIVVGEVAAGSVGFWEREWKGETVYETGWSVLTEFQGQGIATRAMESLLPLARATRRNDAMHAFPSVDNAPSNAICRKLGFELLGEYEFEYPKGNWMTCNDWRLRLRQ